MFWMRFVNTSFPVFQSPSSSLLDIFSNFRICFGQSKTTLFLSRHFPPFPQKRISPISFHGWGIKEGWGVVVVVVVVEGRKQRKSVAPPPPTENVVGISFPSVFPVKKLNPTFPFPFQEAEVNWWKRKRHRAAISAAPPPPSPVMGGGGISPSPHLLLSWGDPFPKMGAKLFDGTRTLLAPVQF